MTLSAKQVWQQLNKNERRHILCDLFYTVLLTHVECPTFMTPEDWKDMFEIADEGWIESDEPNIIRLALEVFVLRYWTNGKSNKFLQLVIFLRVSFADVTLGNHSLFQKCEVNNMTISFDFNMEAVFLWMSTQQLAGPRD